MMRAGDVVRHRGKGQKYVLACDERAGYAAVAGWPDGDIKCSEWDVVEPATDEERLKMLRMAAESRADGGGLSRRALIAREQLAAEQGEEDARG